ncbi:MAG: hypothetical protein U1A72_23430 [Sulfuritalea sp.]|nr:hypothetical protein [Sulfuritalea sp.]
MLIDLQAKPPATRSWPIVFMLAIAVCATLIGCAAEVVRTSTRFAKVGAERGADIVLTESVTVVPVSGYTKTLKGGSTWRHVGDITEGTVFKVESDVFMVEGKHMHEAYCVLDRGYRLVGFYLPVENGFVAVIPAVPLPIDHKRS